MSRALVIFKHCSRCKFIALFVFCLLVFQNAVMMQGVKIQQKQDTAQMLVPNKPVERTIKGSEFHVYTITLKANQFFRVTVDQRGVDVVVSLYAPDGKLLEERDRPNGTRGEESLSAEVMTAGVYRLEVETLEEEAEAGKYEIRLETPRMATAQDKKRISAEKIFQGAEKLRLENTRESWTEAAAKYEEAIPIWREIADRYSEGLTLSTLSGIYDDLGQNDKAIEDETVALAIFRAISNRNAEGDSLLHLARLWRVKRDSEQAARYYEELAQAKQDAGDKQGKVDALKEAAEMFSSLGAIQNRNSQPMKAIEIYQRAIALSQVADDKSGEADALNLIGKIYYGLGDKTKALDYYNRALTLFREAKDKVGEARTERDIGLIIPKETSEGVTSQIEKSEEVTSQISLKAELVVQTGHSFGVRSVTFSPDGKTLASGSFDNTIKLWDVVSRKELKALSGHSSNVYSVAFSPDGKILASGSGDNTIKLWDVESGKELKTLLGHSEWVSSVTFSPDGKTLASGSFDNTNKLWDVESGKELRTLSGHSASVQSVTFSPDGKTLASGSFDNTIKLWDVESGKELRTLSGHSSFVWSVTFSPDGKILASGSEDNTNKLWDVESGKELKTLSGHSFGVSSVAFSPDGKTLASGSDDETIKLWDVMSGKELRTLSGHSEWVNSVTFSPDGKTLASGSGKLIGSGDNTIKLWDVESGRELRTLSGHSGIVNSVTFSPDGKTLASGSWDNTIKLWDVMSGKELRTLSGHSDYVNSVTFSPDGKILASGSFDNTIKLWDVESGKELRTLSRYSNVRSAAFSPDGKTLASGSGDKTIKLWDVESGKGLRTLSGHSDWVQSFTFSPDGKTLASGSGDNTIKLWDVESGKELKALSGHSSFVWSVTFSPDGKTLASGSWDNTIKLWDVMSGKELKTLSGHSDYVNSVTFSPDGRTLASGSVDKTIKLWDVMSGKELESLDRYANDTKVRIAKLFPRLYKDYYGAGVSDKLIAEVSEGAKIKLFEKETHKELATLIALDEKDWVVIDPEGRFDASEGAQKLMYFVVGLEPIDFEQLKDRYYEPGLLHKIINKKPFANKEVQPFTGDELYPSVKYEPIKQGQKTLSVQLKNRGGGIGIVQVRINGKEIIADARPKNFDSKQKEATVVIDLSKVAFLPGEENKIEIFARNAEGWLRSRGSESLYVAEGEKKTDPPELYAIIGGVSDYAEDKLDLRYSSKDAEDFAHALELGAMKVFGKDKVHIRLLSSGAEQREPILKGSDSKQLAPTKDNFKKSFEEFRKAKPTDIFLIYLSGHGTSIKLEGYTGDTYLYLMENAVTTDSTRLLDEKLRSNTTISSVELVQWTRDINAKKQAMILDTCAAGAAENNLIAKKHITTEQTYQILALDRLRDKTGFYVLMGSAANAQAYEATRYGQGLLTYALLEGMKGAGLENEYAFVDKIFKHAVKSVPDLAKGNGLIQEPRVFTPEQSQPFFIGRFTQEEQKQFTLASIKPVILSPIFLNKTKLRDDLNLNPLLKVAFINASFVSSRGRNEAKIIFVEADEMYDAIRPSGVYEINGNTITLKIVLSKNNDSVGESITVTGNINDKDALVKNIVEAVTQAAQKVEKER